MGEYADILRTVPLFGGMTPEELEQVEELVEVMGALTGTTLFEAGAPSDSFYVIAKGQVDIVIDEATRIPLGDGEFFGEIGVLNSAPRSAGAVVTDDSILLKIPKQTFDRVLAMNEVMSAKVLKACVQRVKAGAARVQAEAEGGGEAPREEGVGELAIVYSPRGGAGTTSVAVNLACRVARLTGETGDDTGPRR